MELGISVYFWFYFGRWLDHSLDQQTHDRTIRLTSEYSRAGDILESMQSCAVLGLQGTRLPATFDVEKAALRVRLRRFAPPWAIPAELWRVLFLPILAKFARHKLGVGSKKTWYCTRPLLFIIQFPLFRYRGVLGSSAGRGARFSWQAAGAYECVLDGAEVLTMHNQYGAPPGGVFSSSFFGAREWR